MAALGDQVEKILYDITELTYFMRGGLQYNDALELTTIERQIFSKFLNKYLESEVKKTKPNY